MILRENLGIREANPATGNGYSRKVARHLVCRAYDPCVPGMALWPIFWCVATGSKTVHRDRTEGRHQQGKGTVRKGRAGRKHEVEPRTQRTANRLHGIGERVEQTRKGEARYPAYRTDVEPDGMRGGHRPY